MSESSHCRNGDLEDSQSDQDEEEELQPKLRSKESKTKKLIRQIKVLTLVGMFIICTVSKSSVVRNKKQIYSTIILSLHAHV